MDHFDVDEYFRQRQIENNRQAKRPSYWETSYGSLLLKAFMHAARRPETFKPFLTQILTERERYEIGRRLKAAQYLFAGVPYQGIRGMTGLNPSSIARISKRMQYKTEGVYETLSDLQAKARMEENMTDEEKRRRRLSLL